MYIDPRVAHGRAQFDLDASPRLVPEQRYWEVHSRLNLLGELARQKSDGARRKTLRYLEAQAQQFRKLGMRTAIAKNGPYEGLFVEVLMRSADHGVIHLFLVYDVDTAWVYNVNATTITTHAVARCMQRLGRERVEDIQPEFDAVTGALHPLGSLAARRGWKQIGIPTRSGLFVGEWGRPEGPVLKTFLRPGENGRPSRWSEFADLFSGMPAGTGTGQGTGNYLQIRDFVQAVIDRTGDKAFSERFPFLTELEEKRADPLDERWDAARAAATGSA